MSERLPSVGVVIRTKNRIVLLRRALESVKNQTYPHWRAVVVNDGGAPAAVDDLVAGVLAGDPRVSVLHHPRSIGLEAASNSGLARLDTDLMAIHDDDDSWAPEFLATMTAVLTARQGQFPSIAGVVCRINTVSETVVANHIMIDRVDPWQASIHDRLDEGFLSVQRMLVCNQFPPIAFLCDLAAARALGAFREDLPVLGDWDFQCRFVIRHDIWVHPEFLAFYHHRSTATGDLGNTVYSGADKHRLYGQFLRNGFARAAVSASPENRMALMLACETQTRLSAEAERIQHRLGVIEAMLPALRHERPGWRKAVSRTWRVVRDTLRGRWKRGRSHA